MSDAKYCPCPDYARDVDQRRWGAAERRRVTGAELEVEINGWHPAECMCPDCGRTPSYDGAAE